MEFRIEEDIVGKKEVPQEALYGVQTLRAVENFPITGKKTHPEMIRGFAQVKKACARTNFEAGLMSQEVCQAIEEACDEILAGQHWEAFITDPIQGGAGTSANMNANEVIANLADEKLGGQRGSYQQVHPNDHVNMSQSTNDTFPCAGKMACYALTQELVDKLADLVGAMEAKAQEFDQVVKMGRTQLQDAIPIRLGQEFAAYASVLARDLERIREGREKLKALNLGGTAIGTGLNGDEYYFNHVMRNLVEITGIDWVRLDNVIDQTQNQDALVDFSARLRTCAVNLSKISNDLRLMSSGPRTMVGDIQLPARQNGSSIMPGKVNPVIPEVVNQVAFRVMGNDLTVSLGAEGGQLQLNAFEPVIFYALFESLEILAHGIKTLQENCVEGIVANVEKLEKDVEHSFGLVTALVPHIGYKEATRIAKESLATGKTIRQLALEHEMISPEDLGRILDPYAMTEPGIAAEDLIHDEVKE